MCTKTLFKQVKMLVSSIFNSCHEHMTATIFKKYKSKKFLNFTHMSEGITEAIAG